MPPLENQVQKISPRPALGLLLVALVLLVFGRSAVFEFVTWDDDLNVYTNPQLNPPTAGHLAEFWTKPTVGLYAPMPYTVWWTIAKVAHVDFPDEKGSHLNPWFFHAANVAVHAVAVLVVFGLLRRLLPRTGRDGTWAAFAGAVLFAVHPIQVESVAWVTGMRDLLAGLFAATALWQYMLAASGRRACWAGAAVAAVLAMLSKPTAVVLPVMAFAIDLWIVGRPLRKAIVPAAIGLALLAAPVVYVAHAAQSLEVPAMGPAYNGVLIAGDSLTFYLRKIFWPVHLSADYSLRPAKVLGHAWLYAEVFVPLALLIAAWLVRRRMPFLIVAVILLFAPLLPVSGIVPFNYQYYSTVADRYAYLAMLGVALAGAGVLNRWWNRAAMIVAAVILIALAVRSFLQVRYWHDSSAMWHHVDDLNPGDFAAETQLGMMDVERQQFFYHEGAVRESLASSRRAIEHFRAALRDYPDHGIARKHLAAQELYQGDWNAAVADARALVRTSRAQTIRNAWRYVDLLQIFAAEAHRRGDAADERLFREELARIGPAK